MEHFETEKAGSAATLSSLEDAKAEHPASLSYPTDESLASHLLASSDPHQASYSRIVGPSATRISRSKEEPKELSVVLASGQFGEVRWDNFRHTAVLDRSGFRVDLDQAETTRLLIDCQRLGIRTGTRAHFEQVIEMVAKDNPFDSAQEWLSHLPAWDGLPRVDWFFPNYLGTVSRAYQRAVARYFWTALISRMMIPGSKADMVPVLVGPQGIGKTEFLRDLMPTPELCGEACLTDRPNILTRKASGKPLLVWEEMRGIKGKCDADEVKTFITSPYLETIGRTKTSMDRHPRRFIIVGTSNDKHFLRDPFGNRRFLPIEIGSAIDRAGANADRLQLWAEALQIVRGRLAKGLVAVDYQDAERLAQLEHGVFEKAARWAGDERLAAFLSRDPAPFTAEGALLAMGLRPEMITQRETREMARSLRQLKLPQRSVRVPGISAPVMRWIAK